MKNIKTIIAAALVASFSLGCATDLSKVVILQHRVSVPGAEKGMIPGQSYEVEMAFLGKGSNRWITNPRLDNLEIYSRERRVAVAGTRITPLQPDLTLTGNLDYRLELGIKGNPYQIPPLVIPVRWSAGRAFEFQGREGSSSYLDHGGHGRPGPEVRIEASWYDVKGTSLEGTGNYLLVREVNSNRYMLVNSKEFPVLVSSRGGRGGNGSQGADRYLSGGQTEVYGEPGFDGGDGGQGGVIILTLPDGEPDLEDFFILRTEGGPGGSGGTGGRGEETPEADPNILDVTLAIIGENYGPDGRDGRQGSRGDSRVIRKPLGALFKDFNQTGFDPLRLVPRKPAP